MIELHACKQRSNRSNVTQCIGWYIKAKYRLVYKLHFNKIALGSQRVKTDFLRNNRMRSFLKKKLGVCLPERNKTL